MPPPPPPPSDPRSPEFGTRSRGRRLLFVYFTVTVFRLVLLITLRSSTGPTRCVSLARICPAKSKDSTRKNNDFMQTPGKTPPPQVGWKQIWPIRQIRQKYDVVAEYRNRWRVSVFERKTLSPYELSTPYYGDHPTWFTKLINKENCVNSPSLDRYVNINYVYLILFICDKHYFELDIHFCQLFNRERILRHWNKSICTLGRKQNKV